MFRFLIASFAIAVTVTTVLQPHPWGAATLLETQPLPLATSKRDSSPLPLGPSHFLEIHENGVAHSPSRTAENDASVSQMEALVNMPISEISDKVVTSFSDFETWSSVVPVDALGATPSMMDEVPVPQDISLTTLNQSAPLTTDKES